MILALYGEYKLLVLKYQHYRDSKSIVGCYIDENGKFYRDVYIPVRRIYEII